MLFENKFPIFIVFAPQTPGVIEFLSVWCCCVSYACFVLPMFGKFKGWY